MDYRADGGSGDPGDRRAIGYARQWKRRHAWKTPKQLPNKSFVLLI
jgi:hypothetical protein